MNSQRMTDSSDDSDAVTVHISKHSQVREERRGGGREGGGERRKKGGGSWEGVKKMSKKISSSSPGKKYKLKTHLYPVLFTTDNHVEKMSRFQIKSAPALTHIHTYN